MKEIDVIERAGSIEVRSVMPVGRRVLFFLLAFIPLLAPYELILKPDWQDYFNFFFLISALIAGGAMVLSALFVWSAIAGLDSSLRFDRISGGLTYTSGSAVIGWRTEHGRISEITRLEVETHDWSDGSPSYAFAARLADGRSFKSASSESRQVIEQIAEKVTAFLGLENAGLA